MRNAAVKNRGTRTGLGLISGADEGYPEIYGGDLIEGRWFTKSINTDRYHFLTHAGTAYAVLALKACE